VRQRAQYLNGIDYVMSGSGEFPRPAQGIEGPQQKEIAEEDRLAGGYATVQRRHTPPLIRAVNNIMEQRSSMEQFDGFGGESCASRIAARCRCRREYKSSPNHLGPLKILGQDCAFRCGFQGGNHPVAAMTDVCT
jgi:hypothetical protein